MAAATKYVVVKTFDTATGLKRAGSLVTFKSKKVAKDYIDRGLVKEKKKPGPKPKGEKVKSKQPGQDA